MKQLALAVLIGLAAVTPGCTDLGQQITGRLAVTQLQYAFDKFELIRADIPLITPNASADVLITLKATNPNAVAAMLDRMSFDLLLDGTKVGTGTLINGISVAANTTQPVAIQVNVPYNGLPATAMTALQNRRALVGLQGTSTIATPLGNIGIPVSLQQSVTF